MKNYYQILGIGASASKNEIKEAYIKLSKKIHPDLNSGDSFFTELFKSINEAYQVLIDDDQRSSYNIKFNSYLYDFNSIKEREHELHQREAYLMGRRHKRKIFVRSTLTLCLGLGILTFLSFSFDKPYDPTADIIRPVAEAKIVIPSVQPVVVNAVEAPIAKVIEPAVKPVPLVEKAVESPAFVQIEAETKRVTTNIVKPQVEPKMQAAAQIRAVKRPKVNAANSQLNSVIEQFEAKEKEFGGSSRGITIVRAANCNVPDVFKVAEMLRKKGYIIAGRMSSSIAYEGIGLERRGECNALVIGAL